MVIFDANFLLLLLDPSVDIPGDPATGQSLLRARDRVEHLISTLSQQRETIGIPTPVVGEILVHAGPAGPNYLAAIEVAAMTAAAIGGGGNKKSTSGAPWQKVKIDRQIVAIGAIDRATTIYTDDQSVIKLAKRAGITAVSSWEIPLPPEDPQGRLDI